MIWWLEWKWKHFKWGGKKFWYPSERSKQSEKLIFVSLNFYHCWTTVLEGLEGLVCVLYIWAVNLRINYTAVFFTLTASWENNCAVWSSFDRQYRKIWFLIHFTFFNKWYSKKIIFFFNRWHLKLIFVPRSGWFTF